MKKKLRLLWVIDPWSTLDHEKDTTLRLAEEAMEMGAQCFIAENHSISLSEGKITARVEHITRISRPRSSANIRKSPAMWMDLSGFQHIFYRVDPPIDLSYLLPLQLLAELQNTKKKSAPKIHSTPTSLFFLNEKWAPNELGKLFPKSVVTASTEALQSFLHKNQKAVLKPLYQAQSKGVSVLTYGNALSLSKIESATEGGKLPVILQEYLPGILKGETRLWFSGGKLIASVKKIPKHGESIIDMDRGGTLAKATLSASDKRAAEAVSKLLKKHKILWAAVDLIDGKITDFNHTSPGLLGPMEELLDQNLAKLALSPIFRSK